MGCIRSPYASYQSKIASPGPSSTFDAFSRAQVDHLAPRSVPLRAGALEFGVRGDRCGFGWSLQAALSNFGATFGTPGKPGCPSRAVERSACSHASMCDLTLTRMPLLRYAADVEACDLRGAVLPFPYGTGAGYLFSSALLRWVATSAEVSGWVADAAGEEREKLQWQKFEDTSTGYFVSRAPRRVSYVDIGPLIHDIACHPEGERKRRGGATYRPPANSSIFVHNLKSPTAFAFAWDHMQASTAPYDHESCQNRVYRGRVAPGARRRRGKKSPRLSEAGRARE